MTDPGSSSSKPAAALGRALVVYVGFAFGVLEATELLSGRLGLPDWIFTAVLVILAAGLPLISVTAWLSASGAHRRRTEGAAALPLRFRLFTWKNAVLSGVAALALVGLVQTVGWVTAAAFGPSEADWARREGIRLLEEAMDEGRDSVAYVLALRVEAALPDDADALRLVDRAAPLDTLHSAPSGARVFRRHWGLTGDAWEEVGTTPYVTRTPPWRYPRYVDRPAYVYRLELDGHAPNWVAGMWPGRWEETLLEAGDARAYMARVREPPQQIGMPGLDHLRPPEAVPGFFIDRFEVTNAQFKTFVDAGGYQDPGYWQEAFEENGAPVAWADAVSRFVDRTGRPGPSTWSAGDFPDGEDDHPVAGVSWYEAAAYAVFAGKLLPTVWQWSAASTPERSQYIVSPANMADRAGTRAVGATGSMTALGVFDMAGNVREWVYNENPTNGGRYLLGGGYDDPSFAFNDAASFSAWDRAPSNGFRLASWEDPEDGGIAQARAPLPSLVRDFGAEIPVSDEIFEVYRRMYDYDPMPLEARIEQADTTADYIGELVTVDAAYGGERLMIYLYRPPEGVQPFQTVIYFPGSGVIYGRRSQIGSRYQFFDFLVKNGRAVAFPVYKGTWERGGDLDSDYPSETAGYREYVVQWVQDLNRTIDYIEARPDLDAGSLGYFGRSWGAYLGGIIPAVTPRLDVAVLQTAGLPVQRALPEVDLVNYLPRVTIPVIMINGEHDPFFPLETSQTPMFEMLGTPPGLKRHVVYPGAHGVPRDRLIQETLDFFDEHLGPVAR